jgi:hypothetical protein
MAETLRVLVYGSIDAGVCDSVRLGVYRDLLAEHDVELRTWGEFNDYRIQVPADYADRLDDAVRDGVATIDLSPIEWADVLVFRRWYGTVYACDDCDYAASDSATLAGHCRENGHAPVMPATGSSATCWIRSSAIERCCAGGRWSTSSTTTCSRPSRGSGSIGASRATST